jgi:pyruvate kinase
VHPGAGIHSRDVREKPLLAGMNVAKLNFSHGDFSGYKEVIANLRTAARAIGRRLTVMADLSGPKMRIGKFDFEPIERKPGDLSLSRQTALLAMRTGFPSPSPASPGW